MLTLYLLALGFGGTLVAASVVLSSHSELGLEGSEAAGLLDGGTDAGSDLDADFAANPDANADAGDAHVDHELSGFDAVLGWLPITSIRFWTFFLAFFGLTGAVLTVFGLFAASETVIGAVAASVGYLSGIGMVKTMNHLRNNQVDSSLSERDYIGATATVMLAVGVGRTGKVRMMLKGRQIELLAETEENVTFAAKDQVMVYRLNEEGHAMVTRSHQLTE